MTLELYKDASVILLQELTGRRLEERRLAGLDQFSTNFLKHGSIPGR